MDKKVKIKAIAATPSLPETVLAVILGLVLAVSVGLSTASAESPRQNPTDQIEDIVTK